MKGRFSAIIPPVAPETGDTALDRLFDPACFFDDPRDVVSAPDLDLAEKRAILATWASDACAVDSMPALRKPPGAKRPVTFDEIMDALRSLDARTGRSERVTRRMTTHQLDA